MARSPHKTVHADCPNGAATWSDCDRAVEDIVRDWQAMQTVILAFNIASEGRRINEDNFLAQLIDYISGHSRDLLNKDGNPAISADAMRVRAAIERFKAGDLPAYNLYTPTRASN